jgi:hypothetical protein
MKAKVTQYPFVSKEFRYEIQPHIPVYPLDRVREFVSSYNAQQARFSPVHKTTSPPPFDSFSVAT